MSANNPNQGQAPQEAMSPRDAMMQSVDAAREATKPLGDDYYYKDSSLGKTTESMYGGSFGPEVRITEGRGETRVSAESEIAAPNTETQYQAYDRQGQAMHDKGRVSIKRYDHEGNEVYKFTTNRPEAAQKFAAKIGEHVTNRAQAKAANNEEKAA